MITKGVVIVPAIIENILVFGDSLSDRGAMANSALAAFSGLWGKSPHGRFTNGYVWLDYFIRQLKTEDEVQLVPPQFETKHPFFSINNDEYVGIETAPVFARTYCIGGMTSYDYSSNLTPGKFMRNTTSQFLENLDGLREEAIKDDTYMKLSEDEKKTTLVIEWSGANDLVTVNPKPTMKAAERAVTARIQHVEAMIEQGYMHFVLFNLADLSLTPRYQNEPYKLRLQAHHVSDYFNQELHTQLEHLKIKYPACQLDIFDANALFCDAYENPSKYALDESTKTQPFLDSVAFKDDDPSTTADGYMFWDDVHPTEAVHLTLGRAFHKQVFLPNYVFNFTEQPLVRQFQKMYGMRLEDDMQRRCMPRAKSFDYSAENLHIDQIVRHGLFQDGKRTNSVMQALQWSDKKGVCTRDDTILQEAFTAAYAQDESQRKNLSRK
tara:strand:+ start:4518 stop:5828 length:1311 start_codon:yes stop_codon:yes gene_type:complete